MNATINGEGKTLPSGTTLGALLRDIGLAERGIAVAVNERVVRRSAFETHALRDGDAVEIIRAVAGG